MTHDNDQHQPEYAAKREMGAALYSIAVLFCATEMVPGWSLLHTGWPAPMYYGIMIVCGAVAGSWEVSIRWAGALGGALAGAGSLFVLSLFLDGTQEIPDWMLIGAMAIGMLPGFLLYRFLLEIVRIAKGEPLAPEEQARRVRLFIISAVLGAGALTLTLIVALQ